MKALKLYICLMLLSSCGNTNYLQFMADETSEASALEKARVEIDSKKYSDASATLAGISSDSNEKRKLLASSRLGAAGIDFWNIIVTTINEGISNLSFDSFLALVDSALESTYGISGTDERRAALIATDEAINELLTAPGASAPDIQSMACMIAALDSIPLSTTLTSTLNGLQTSLNSLVLDPTDPSCPDTTSLETAMEDVTVEMGFLGNVLLAIKNCGTIINPDKSGSLNAIEQTLKILLDNADQGCSSSGASCSTVECRISSCLSDSSTAQADDGEVSTCELVENCLSGNCF